MIINYLSQHPGVTLLLGFLLGMLDMSLFVLVFLRFTSFLNKRRQKQTKVQQEVAALQRQEEAPIEIEDDRITCPLCWESRHPGQVQWNGVRGQHCSQHALVASSETEQGWRLAAVSTYC